ncbi:MAG: hypothetical protein JRN42_07180 [Nitrososphaerota archaeon]|nr:hypothetical protein [Nitrososphaerota archaeon]
MRGPRHLTGDMSPDEFEEDQAGRIGGRRIKGSGSQWHAKHDARSGDVLAEAKTTDGKTYALSAEYLLALMRRDADIDRAPLFEVYFRRHGLRATVTLEREGAGVGSV